MHHRWQVDCCHVSQGRWAVVFPPFMWSRSVQKPPYKNRDRSWQILSHSLSFFFPSLEPPVLPPPFKARRRGNPRIALRVTSASGRLGRIGGKDRGMSKIERLGLFAISNDPTFS
ncbi:hypothetical protein BRADI_2g28093v3 [Brachypodium distachyon]|uniref:Uncharacterized protein n=1 Tax=Brachypodium distachyon TaxID=15368 RepID=A0A2K2DB27_BRADI|nr:hypothetical protein BRADI_2g28093v3 [Brachypodium distachyon]